MRRGAAVAGLVGLTMAVAGCASAPASPGNGAVSAKVSGTPSAVFLATPTSAGHSTAASLATADPCSFLSAEDATEVALDPHGQADGARGCVWRGSVYQVTVTIQPGQGVSALPGATAATNVHLHRFTAVEVSDDNSTDCRVAIGITASSRVDVLAAGQDFASAQCAHAAAIAQDIEPLLPSS